MFLMFSRFYITSTKYAVIQKREKVNNFNVIFLLYYYPVCPDIGTEDTLLDNKVKTKITRFSLQFVGKPTSLYEAGRNFHPKQPI